jgi:phosphate ABC transporter phosphate-binding protein
MQTTGTARTKQEGLMKTLAKSIWVGVVLAIVGCGGGGQPKPKELKGGGSTFVAPLMVHWAAAYEAKLDGHKVDYNSAGSYNGIKFLIEKKVDFGCSDAPMTGEELAKAQKTGGEVLHIPLVLGAVVPVFNLAEVKEDLRFTGPVLADIYLGKIKSWDAPALKELNPGVKLPKQEIQVVYRRDGSGTTYIWADYLAKASPEWQKKVGVATEIKWPVGAGEPGNVGVAKKVGDTPGSLGYVELSAAIHNELSFGLVQNRDKEFVKGSLKSVKAAAANSLAAIPDNLCFSLTDAPGKDSYPIAGATWAIVYVKQPADKGQLLVDFLGWAVTDGQDMVQRLFYARLPEDLADRSRKMIDRIEVAK